ncbi:MAG TPA: hypothetical protein VHU83_09210 [Bryobacteraceae bacterium]|jgi:hypothetical protein|nr:hypothetical protein [Bryobacteraceae bacterium]
MRHLFQALILFAVVVVIWCDHFDGVPTNTNTARNSQSQLGSI